MQSEIYLASIIISIGGLWYLWDQGLKKLLLDFFRERLFELRFQLFQLAESGQISFDDEAYRALETLFCGLLRFAHRVTFLGFLLSIREQFKAKQANEYVDHNAQIELKISQAPAEVRGTLRSILSETHTMVAFYMGVSSLLFLLVGGVYLVLRVLNVVRDETKKASAVVESEAYWAESRRRPAMAA